MDNPYKPHDHGDTSGHWSFATFENLLLHPAYILSQAKKQLMSQLDRKWVPLFPNAPLRGTPKVCRYKGDSGHAHFKLLYNGTIFYETRIESEIRWLTQNQRYALQTKG